MILRQQAATSAPAVTSGPTAVQRRRAGGGGAGERRADRRRPRFGAGVQRWQGFDERCLPPRVTWAPEMGRPPNVSEFAGSGRCDLSITDQRKNKNFGPFLERAVSSGSSGQSGYISFFFSGTITTARVFTFSSPLRRGHANLQDQGLGAGESNRILASLWLSRFMMKKTLTHLLCIVPILTDVPKDNLAVAGGAP